MSSIVLHSSVTLTAHVLILLLLLSLTFTSSLSPIPPSPSFSLQFFLQLKGDMCLKIVEKNQHKDVVIKEGEVRVHHVCACIGSLLSLLQFTS